MILFLIIPALLFLSLLATTNQRDAVILLAALLPTYLLRFHLFGLPTNFFETAVAIVFLFICVQPTQRQQWRAVWRNTPRSLLWLIALFVISTVISTVISPHLLTSLGILKSWVIIPLLFGWLILTTRFSPALSINNPTQLHQPTISVKIEPNKAIVPDSSWPIIRSLVLSGDIVALFGLLQINHLDRIRSIYDVPNSLALYLVPLLVLSVWLSFYRYNRLFYIPSSIILAAAIVATQSVAGLVTVVIVVSIGFILFQPAESSLNKKKLYSRRWLVLVFFLLVSLGYLSSTGRLAYLLRPAIVPTNHNSISVRHQLWSISLDLIKDHPVLGTGLGTFEPAYQNKLHARFQEFDECKQKMADCVQPLSEFVYRDPHNWLLSFWLNTGLLGLTSFSLLNAHVLKQALAPLSKPTKTKSPVTYQSQALVLVLLSLLVFGLADTVYWKNDLSTMFWIILSLLITFHQPKAGLFNNRKN